MSLSNRVNFATSADIPNYPDFLDIQVKSFKDFFQLETKSNERSDEGLYKTFLENLYTANYYKSIKEKLRFFYK